MERKGSVTLLVYKLIIIFRCLLFRLVPLSLAFCRGRGNFKIVMPRCKELEMFLMLQQILPLVMLFKIKTMFTEAISLGKMVRKDLCTNMLVIISYFGQHIVVSSTQRRMILSAEKK